MGLAYGVLTPAKSISKAFYSLKKGNAAAERVFDVIDLDSEYLNDSKKNQLVSFKSQISFNNVSFKYDQNKIKCHASLNYLRIRLSKCFSMINMHN